MNTREKIIDASQAALVAASGATVVSGYFDPLVASHAERLAQLKASDKKLLVLIATYDNEILPAAARAELVAGLRCVDYVAVLTDAMNPQVSLEEEDVERFAALLAHVHARQKAAS